MKRVLKWPFWLIWVWKRSYVFMHYWNYTNSIKIIESQKTTFYHPFMPFRIYLLFRGSCCCWIFTCFVVLLAVIVVTFSTHFFIKKCYWILHLFLICLWEYFPLLAEFNCEFHRFTHCLFVNFILYFSMQKWDHGSLSIYKSMLYVLCYSKIFQSYVCNTYC